MGVEDDIASEYARRVGERLRSIRRQKRLSLHEVEELSAQEFKASVLGAYERGERAISVPRLERLSRFYAVPIDQLLPRVAPGVDPVLDLTDPADAPSAVGGVTLDLTQLDSVAPPEGEMLARYLGMIQVQRQDFNGRVLTIREDDLRAVACILGVEIEAAVDRLIDLGLTRQPGGTSV